MFVLIAIVLVLAYAIYLAFILSGIAKGKFHYLLIYLVSFLPIYIVFLSFTYAYLEVEIITKFIQYSKEMVILFTMIIWVLGREKSLLNSYWNFSTLDWLFISFAGLSFLYLILPIGEADFVNKATYYKNIVLLCFAYLFGRQIRFSYEQWQQTFKVVITITTVAFIVVILERLTSTHFHSYVGYASYISGMLDIEPAGVYGLNWTFQAQGGQPRYGAIFSNPLEFSASMLISFAIALIYLLFVKFESNKFKYLGLLFAVSICVMLAYSRATFVAFFIMVLFMAMLLRFYKIIIAAGCAGALLVIYILFFAPDDTRYFVEDTLLFQNSSSITHAIEWLEGVDSMIQNPMGIGLATSGNAGGVDDDLKVGGENQYLIFGVQLGFLGLIIYLGMLYYGIRNGWRAYRTADTPADKIVPFIAASVKFGLLLPLFTANAESYLYVSLFSWWLIGATETIYQAQKRTALVRYQMKLSQ
ncbi:MAG: O-antigen ligase domain-containing protein [Roseivirga sp.]|nr:O-antigen ligase domain-containing protein [Roseivirga sp.]